MKRLLSMTAVALAALLGTTGCGATSTSGTTSQPRPPATPATPGTTAQRTASTTDSPATAAVTPLVRYIAVSVATLWVQPGITRPVDRPALTNPANPRLWVSQMTTADKRWLVGRLETQVLYGTRVYILAWSGTWAKIAVPSQPTARNVWGYPGWVPRVQLTAVAPMSTRYYGIVRARTAWLYTSRSTIGSAAARVMEVSYDTRFPVVYASSTQVEIVMLGGVHRGIAKRDIAISNVPWYPTRARMVGEARKMLGLGYLWAGTSGFGYDCSGFTYSIFHAMGVQLRRDASDQARYGTAVAKAALLPGDLVFFRNSAGSIVHVAMVYGTINGVRYVIESPATGLAVRLTPLSHWTWQYAGARRYLTS